MGYTHKAYRVDWPAEASLGRTRFYGIDDSGRMSMHVQHGADFQPKIVPLYEKDKGPCEVWIDYTNYRGERAWRLIDCSGSTSRFGVSEFHTEPQWLMTALDVVKGEEREFAVKDIHETRKAVTTEMQFQLKPKA